MGTKRNFSTIIALLRHFHSTSNLSPVAITSAQEADDAVSESIVINLESVPLRFSSNTQLPEAIIAGQEAITVAPDAVTMTSEPVTLIPDSVIGVPDVVTCRLDSVTHVLDPVTSTQEAITRAQEPVTEPFDAVSAVPVSVIKVRVANMQVYCPN